MAAALTLTVGFTGCAATSSDAVACREIDQVVTQWGMAIESNPDATSMDSLKATAASADQYVDELRQVEVVGALASLRDDLADGLDRWHAEVQRSVDGTGIEQVTGDLAGVQVDIVSFCESAAR